MKLEYKNKSTEFYTGDAAKMDAIEDGSIHLVCTSPPYWNAREYSNWENYSDYLDNMQVVYNECYRTLVNGGRIAVNVPLGYGRSTIPYMPIGIDTTRLIIEAGFTLRGHVIWDKGMTAGTAWGSWMSPSNPSLRDVHEIIIVAHKGSEKRDGGKESIDRDTFLDATQSVWHVQPVSNHWHPAPWPPELPRRLIELYTFVDDRVLDPFCGSGTTVHVASRLKRYGIGIDKNRDYLRRAAGEIQVDLFGQGINV